jgi:hypothetical protein
MEQSIEELNHDMNEPLFPSNHHVYIQQLNRKYLIKFDDFTTDLLPPLKGEVVAHMEQLWMEIEALQKTNQSLLATVHVLENEVGELTKELQREVTPMMEINGHERTHIQWLCDIARDKWQMNFTRLQQVKFQVFQHQPFARAHCSSIMINRGLSIVD